MNKETANKFFKNLKYATSKHTPEILIGVGIVGMATTTVLAVKATPKALQLIEAKKQKESKDELTAIETVKTAWKPYIPAVITGTMSIACLVGASSVSARRNAALYSAYKLSETALSEYKQKVVEEIGEKKEQIIEDKIAQDKVEKDPVTKSEVIITEKGNTLCYDTISGRYFKSDIERIKRTVNELNRRMINEMYVSLSEFYIELGLETTRLSDDLGWNLDDGLIDVDFSSQIADDGTPCIVVDYRIAPRYDFCKLM